MSTGKNPRIKSWTRIWQRRGFGVHSPYAYRLITEVLREKARFYAYDEIQYILNNSSGQRADYKVKKKRGRLLFRIVNRYQPEQILEIGSSGGVTTLYIQHACSRAAITILEPRSARVEDTRRWLAARNCVAEVVEVKTWKEGIKAYLQKTERPFILVNHMRPYMYEGLAEVLQEALHPYAVVIVAGIGYKTPRKLWRSLVSDTRVRVSMDMQHSGLLLCNPKLNKQNYFI